MNTSTVTITFNGSYIYSSDMPYSAFGRGFGGNKYNRRCIDGTVTGCGKCVGYCTFYEHEGFLTKELRKKHDCLRKGCRYYVARVKTP